MQWDVFVSYANEDKKFARRLAQELESSGLRVWFDETALEAGDSLRRSIDRGLSESRYGVVILSSHFFKKEWPQRELDGLTQRDDGKSKVIIPVWYKVSADDVRAFSPILADKLSIYSSGSVNGVVAKILRAIEKDKVGATGWKPSFTKLTDGTELVVLPVRPYDNHAVCIGRYPVTNSEYKTFVENSPYSAPVGENYVNEDWRGPFAPWEDSRFSHGDCPVVCVTFWDAINYCKWLGKEKTRIFLPTSSIWDFAALGRSSSYIQVPVKPLDPSVIHHRSSAPASIDRTGSRENSLGVSDMIGNVWEWVGGDHWERPRLALLAGPPEMEPELRGGGFLDNLEVVHPYLRAGMLEDGTRTSHTDLGFRVAALVPIDALAPGVVAILQSLPAVSHAFYEQLHYIDRYYHYYSERFYRE